MIISDENSFPILLDSVDTPLRIDYFWALDVIEKDFKLFPIQMNEELLTPSLILNILDFAIEIPANWNMLIYSEDTCQVDTAEISDLTRGDFTALVYNHKTDKIIPGRVRVVDYFASSRICTPSLQKTNMLCHALGPDYWVMVAPTDAYNKYLKNTIIGDFFA